MKSAIGIGALLMDGLGDTIRVSLTEDPEFEMDPCKRLAGLGERAWGSVRARGREMGAGRMRERERGVAGRGAGPGGCEGGLQVELGEAGAVRGVRDSGLRRSNTAHAQALRYA